MFKVDRLRFEDVVPPLTKEVRYWDKAGSHGRGCYTVGVRMGRDDKGHFWVTDIVRGQWDAEERERKIEETAKEDGIKVTVWVEQEPGSGGKESAEATQRRLAGYIVRLDRPSGDKVLRADPYAVQVNGGNVYVRTAEWNREYREELRFFPNSKYKDQVDASSGAFAAICHARLPVGALQ